MLEKFFLGEKLKRTRVLKHLYLLVIVYFGWVFFRFSDFGMMRAVLAGMFCLNKNPFASYEISVFAFRYLLFYLICLIGSTPLLKNIGVALKRRARTSLPAFYLNGALSAVLPAVLIVLSVLSLVGDSYNPFLYFQF